MRWTLDHRPDVPFLTVRRRSDLVVITAATGEGISAATEPWVGSSWCIRLHSSTFIGIRINAAMHGDRR